jgi:hypothetical protein
MKTPPRQRRSPPTGSEFGGLTHFHSSTTSGSAALMIVRTFCDVSPEPVARLFHSLAQLDHPDHDDSQIETPQHPDSMATSWAQT